MTRDHDDGGERPADRSTDDAATDGPSGGPRPGRPRADWSRRSVLRTAGAGVGALLAGAGAAGTAVADARTAGDTDYDLAAALRKSLYFYDANVCGEDAGEASRLIWRGDCHDEHDTAVTLEAPVEESGTNLSAGFVERHREVLDPEGTGTVDLSGGYHDAGDHVKFGVPQAYAASTLAWSVHEFEDAFRAVGSLDHVRSHLRRFAEYFLNCTFRDDDGVVTFCHQVGNGGSAFDHDYWGPAELQTTATSTRPAYFATPDDQAGAATAGAAAALAAIGAVFEGVDDDLADRSVSAARDLYEFAVENPGVTDYAAPFYDPSGSADERCWAGIWLHVATGEDRYLEEVVGETADGRFTGHVSEIVTSRSDTWRNRWVHSWDSVWGGVLLKLAELTGDDYFRGLSRWHLSYWSGGAVEHRDGSGGYIDTTPAGFSWLNRWGSARYNAAAQLTAMAHRDAFGLPGIGEWALGQMEYVMGSNPFGYSLIVGFTDDHAERPHHDTAHGSLSGEPSTPTEHRHTLWGALVGGPDANDGHVDETGNYVLNEVAIDFNAGLVGALAGLYDAYGEDPGPREDFLTAVGDDRPFYATAAVSDASENRIDYKAFVHNESFHPAEYEDGLSVRYFLDASGLIENGGSVEDLTVDVTYDQVGAQLDGSVSVVGPEPWDEAAGIYYVEFDYSGVEIHGRYELSFALAEYTTGGFDPGTDPSRAGISREGSVVPEMPVYVDGERVFGETPPGPGPDDGENADEGEDESDSDDDTGGGDAGDGSDGSDGDGPTFPEGATDVDGDGYYEDLNGNGRVDYDDVVTYFENMENERMRADARYYDYNDNGRIDYTDLIDLFRSVE